MSASTLSRDELRAKLAAKIQMKKNLRCSRANTLSNSNSSSALDTITQTMAELARGKSSKNDIKKLLKPLQNMLATMDSETRAKLPDLLRESLPDNTRTDNLCNMLKKNIASSTTAADNDDGIQQTQSKKKKKRKKKKKKNLMTTNKVDDDDDSDLGFKPLVEEATTTSRPRFEFSE